MIISIYLVVEGAAHAGAAVLPAVVDVGEDVAGVPQAPVRAWPVMLLEQFPDHPNP